jgi:hypothetical protein
MQGYNLGINTRIVMELKAVNKTPFLEGGLKISFQSINSKLVFYKLILCGSGV